MNLKRMNEAYIRIFAISMLLGILYLCIHYIYEDSIWKKILGIHIQASPSIRMVTFSEKILPDDCDDDQFIDVEKYLQHRRRCILRHCGDVCKTSVSSSERKMFISFY